MGQDGVGRGRGARRRSRARLLAAACAAALVLVACGGDDGDASDATVASTAAPGTTGATGTTGTTGSATTAVTAPTQGCTATQPGTSVTMGNFSQTQGLDPVRINGGGVSGGTENIALYDVLMRFDADTGKYVGQTAESLTPNADFTVWTLKLHPGIKFANGDPYDAAAVKASMQRFQDPANKSVNLSNANRIKQMDVLDPLTLKMTVDAPWGGFPAILSGVPGMVSNAKVAAALGPDKMNLAPVGAGAGPYELVSWEPGAKMVFKARKDYWGGPVCIENLTFVTIPGGQATYDAFRKGEVQAAFLREAGVIADARAAGDAKNSLAMAGASDGVLLMNMGFPNSTPATADVRLRKAIAMAIDTDLVDERVNGGKGKPIRTILDPDLSRWWTPKQVGIPYDPDQAAKLVAEVKQTGINGQRPWDGKLKLTCSTAPSSVEFSVTVEAMLEKVGFDVTVDGVATVADLLGKIRVNHDFDAGCWGINASDATIPMTFDFRFRSTSQSNEPGLKDPRMDAILDDLNKAQSDADYESVFDRMQALWNELVPVVSYATVEQVTLFKPDIKGATYSFGSVVLFDKAYIDK